MSRWTCCAVAGVLASACTTVREVRHPLDDRTLQSLNADLGGREVRVDYFLSPESKARMQAEGLVIGRDESRWFPIDARARLGDRLGGSQGDGPPRAVDPTRVPTAALIRISRPSDGSPHAYGAAQGLGLGALLGAGLGGLLSPGPSGHDANSSSPGQAAILGAIGGAIGGAMVGVIVGAIIGHDDAVEFSPRPAQLRPAEAGEGKSSMLLGTEAKTTEGGPGAR